MNGLFSIALAASLAWGVSPMDASRPATSVHAAATGGADERAIEVATRALAAIERHWALGAYDRAERVRASVNLRGPAGLGLTANAVLDRPGRRWRLDAAGDVGPLSLFVDDSRSTLHVPGLEQYAARPAGSLAPGANVARSLTAEVAGVRSRLSSGYPFLVYRGEATIGGTPSHVIEDTPEPGVTATYWIDAATDLPRRVVVARPGRRDVRLDFVYGTGPRPTRVEAYLEGERDLRLVVQPAYDGAGRARHLHVDATVVGGASYAADVNLDWSFRPAAGFFRFDAPPGARQVPFGQLAQGIAFQAVGKLGGLLQILMGTN